MKHVKQTPDGLIESKTGRKIVSPSDCPTYGKIILLRLQKLVPLLEKNGYTIDRINGIDPMHNSIELRLTCPSVKDQL